SQVRSWQRSGRLTYLVQPCPCAMRGSDLAPGPDAAARHNQLYWQWSADIRPRSGGRGWSNESFYLFSSRRPQRDSETSRAKLPSEVQELPFHRRLRLICGYHEVLVSPRLQVLRIIYPTDMRGVEAANVTHRASRPYGSAYHSADGEMALGFRSSIWRTETSSPRNLPRDSFRTSSLGLKSPQLGHPGPPMLMV